MADHTFLSYAKEDLAVAERLYRDLRSIGVCVWFDRESLKPGQKWKSAIPQAIRNSAYFLFLISRTSIDKRGVVQRELREALEVLEEIPEHKTFIIPVRLEDCVPSHPKLLDLQSVDLFPSYEEGFLKLKSVLIPNKITSDSRGQLSDHPQIAVTFCQRFGDEARQLLHGLTTDPTGNITILGDFWGGIDFGGAELKSIGDRDIFVARFGPTGAHIWSKRYGDQSEHVGVGVVADPRGDIFLLSAFRGTVDFGAGPLVAKGRYNVALAKVDGAGNHLWSHVFGDEKYHVSECIDVSPSGQVVIAGRFQGCINFGGGEVASRSEQTDVFVAAFSSNGDYLWAKRFGGRYDQQTRSLAIDADGNIALGGVFKGEIDFDGRHLNAQNPTTYCGFLAKLDASGNVLWCKCPGDPHFEQVSAATFDRRTGDLLVTGFIRNMLPPNLCGKGQSICSLYRFDESGILQWAKTFGTHAFPDTLSIAPDGRILLAGHFENTVDFGQGPMTSAGGYDVFAVVFGPDGNSLWSKRFGDEWQQFLIRGIFGYQGSVVLAGSFHGTMSFGATTLIAAGYNGTSQGTEDVFLAILKG